MNETLADHLLNSRGWGLPGHRPRLPAPQSPGRYQHLAAINAMHTGPVTDWNQLLALYDQLARLDSSPSRKPWTGALAGWRSAPGSSFWWTLTPIRQDRRPSC
jgi:hypothetical protein